MTKFISFLLALSCVLAIPKSSIALTNTPNQVVITNERSPLLSAIPKTIVITKHESEEIAKAQRFVYSEIKTEIEHQKSLGATKLTKTFISEDNYSYPDWKEYVPEIRQYVIKGFAEDGKLVRTSAPLASDLPNLASRLVYLEQNECILRDFSLFDLDTWFTPKCHIKFESKSDYIRASLRTAIAMSGLGPWALGQTPYEQMQDCFNNKYSFTVKSGYFSCPQNVRFWPEPSSTSFPLILKTYKGGYVIKIDVKTRSATMTYYAPNFVEVARHAFWSKGSSVINFG